LHPEWKQSSDAEDKTPAGRAKQQPGHRYRAVRGAGSSGAPERGADFRFVGLEQQSSDRDEIAGRRPFRERWLAVRASCGRSLLRGCGVGLSRETGWVSLCFACLSSVVGCLREGAAAYSASGDLVVAVGAC
jgi:hypothetical protein